MSGECPKCNNHTLECVCMNEIYVWAQMFFDDGSVSQGKRVLDSIYDQNDYMEDVAAYFLKDLHRTEGLLLVWGAGDMKSKYYVFTSSSLESKTLALESSKASCLLQKTMPQLPS